MKRIYKLIQVISSAALLLIFAGCSQEVLKAPSTGSGTALGSGTATASSGKYYVTGSVAFDSAALPKELITQNNQSARTASGYFSQDVWSCEVKAVQEGTIISANIIKEGIQYSYTLELPTKGEWDLYVSFKVNNTVINPQQAKITIPETAQSNYSISKTFRITTSPAVGSGKNGSINLKITNNSENVSKIIWDFVDETVPYDTERSVSGPGESVFFNFDSIDSGNYKVKISFEDAEGKDLYSCYENIIVFFDFVTDTWYGPSPYINDSNEFVYEDNLSANYAKDIKTLDIKDGEEPYLLWSDFEYESDSISYNLPEQNELGGQIFTNITEGMLITEAVECSSNFCFDGTSLYVPPYRYVNTYAGFAKDPFFNLNDIISSVNPDVTVESFPYSCMVLDKYLYFIFTIDNGSQLGDYIGRYGINDHTFAITQGPVNQAQGSRCTAFTVVHNQGNAQEGILYYTIESSSSVLYRKPFIITESGNDLWIVFNTDGIYKEAEQYINTFEDVTSAEQYSLIRNLSVSDMVMVEDKLYLLVYISGSLPDLYTKEGDSQYIPVSNAYISTGGVMKFIEDDSQKKTTSFSTEGSKWSKSNTSITDNKVLGLFTYTDPDPQHNIIYYQYNNQTSEYEALNETIDIDNQDGTYSHYYYFIPVQPELEDGNKPNQEFLYGPRKFLSASSTELVFVDDGGYIQDPSDPGTAPSTLPVNRIATLNLGTEDFSFVNVNATFSAALSPITGSFKPNPYSGGMIIPGPGPKP